MPNLAPSSGPPEWMEEDENENGSGVRRTEFDTIPQQPSFEVVPGSTLPTNENEEVALTAEEISDARGRILDLINDNPELLETWSAMTDQGKRPDKILVELERLHIQMISASHNKSARKIGLESRRPPVHVSDVAPSARSRSSERIKREEIVPPSEVAN